MVDRNMVYYLDALRNRVGVHVYGVALLKETVEHINQLTNELEKIKTGYWEVDRDLRNLKREHHTVKEALAVYEADK